MTDEHQELIRGFWDRDAHTYDLTASHAISDPVERAAWRTALLEALPERGSRVLDVGAGTGALTLLAAELGYRVTALDLSPSMLAHAERKAAEAGLEVGFVVGSGSEPPSDGFDAVMERHVLWTMPEPVDALRAWRDVVVPGGRVVLFEGIWGGWSITRGIRDRLSQVIRQVLGSAPDHHGPYPEEVLERLPFRQMPSPRPLVDALHEAGWTKVRMKRLRDVEWAGRLHEPWPLGWLEALPRFVLVGEA